MPDTAAQYAAAHRACRSLFERKMRDYGTAWRIMRLPSLTDQLYIKAKRVRQLDQGGENRVGEGIAGEFVALVNYALLALVQDDLGGGADAHAGGSDGVGAPVELPHDVALGYYDRASAEVRALMEAKNHDYGEAWRDMRVSSLTDLILMKLHRIKQIEDNAGATEVSEGVRGGYADIANYALFALIKLGVGDA